MIVVDVILIALLIAALIGGAARGLSGSVGVLLGLAAGGVGAYWLVPLVNDVWPWQDWRSLVVIVSTVLVLVLGASIGGALGAFVRRGVDRTPLRAIDRLLGAATGVLFGALALSLAGGTIAATGMPVVSSAVSSSAVLRTIDRLTPQPVSAAMAELRGLVVDEGLPRLGELLEVTAPPSVPPVDLDDPELARAAASVARVSGTAYACGTSSTGTGFVIAPDRVVTNAHVVAGVDAPVVELPGIAAREGRIVWFDPVDDLAVIAVDDLGVAPLPTVDTLSPGSAAVVQGYPLGGPFTMISAGVLSVGTVPVPDIYGDSSAPRDIYSLQSAVRPGNSGGPLLDAQGQVAGVVFARGEDDAERGYAVTMTELTPVINAAPGLADAVSSGRCTT